MTEQVLITPGARLNAQGDPVVGVGAPFPLQGRVAPGNTAEKRGTGGELESVDFTIYFTQLRVRVGDDYVRTVDALTEPFTVEVRGKKCHGRVQLWDESGRGGVVVLASSRTGKTVYRHSANT